MVSDRNYPVFSTPTPPTQPWRDDTIAGTPQSFSYTAAARDGGLGMKWLTLRRPDRTATEGVVNQRDRGCAGVQGAFPCTAQAGAYSQQFSYQLNQPPEGSNLISVTAKDQIDRARTISWQQPIDRSAPTTPALSGSLKTDAAKLWITRDYELSVSATDGVAVLRELSQPRALPSWKSSSTARPRLVSRPPRPGATPPSTAAR